MKKIGDERKMNKEIFKKLKGKPVIIVKKDGFAIKGVIYTVFDDTIEFVTSSQASYIDFNTIAEIRQRGRDPWEEPCGNCGSVFYLKTSYDTCPFCNKQKSGCADCGK